VADPNQNCQVFAYLSSYLFTIRVYFYISKPGSVVLVNKKSVRPVGREGSAVYAAVNYNVYKRSVRACMVC